MRKILVLVLLIFTGHRAASQFNYGMRVGTQLTTLSNNMGIKNEWKTSYHAGLFGSYSFTKKTSIVADLLYADKGYTTSERNNKKIYHLKYLSIPLMLHYNFTKRISVLGGGEIGFLLNSYLKDGDQKYALKSSYSKAVDIGLLGGIGYQLTPRTQVILNYTYGLTNVMNKNDFYTVSSNGFSADIKAKVADYNSHNHAIQLSLRWALHKSAYITKSVFRDSSDYAVPKFAWGIKAGFNFNNTYYRYLRYKKDDSKTAPGLHVGVFVQLRLAKTLSFIPELQAIRKGYTYAAATYSQYAYESVSLYYVEAPLMLSYAPSKLFSIEAGPVGGLLVYSPPIKSLTSRQDKYTKFFEFGICAGLHFNVLKKFSLAARYYRGLTNISDLYTYAKEYNTNVQISTYYKIIRKD